MAETAEGAPEAKAAATTYHTEPDNRMVWSGSPGHYEVWYLTLNHRASRTGFWIRYTMEAPRGGEPYAQLWFACFDAADPARGFALNRRAPIASLRADASPFSVAIGDAVLYHDGARGELRGDGHAARWDLGWTPAPRTHRHLPELVYRTSFADTRVLSPNLDVLVSGTVEIDGRTLVFEGEPGGQTHVWGRKHAHAWAWGHCNAFEGRPGVALEALTVRLRRAGLVLPRLTLLTLVLDGEVHRFTDFSSILATSGRFERGRYVFAARGATARLEGEFTCRPDDMILTEYHDPDGEPAWCANTEVGHLRVTVWRRSGRLSRWREDVTLRAPGTGHFEVAGRQPDPAIRRRHVTV